MQTTKAHNGDDIQFDVLGAGPDAPALMLYTTPPGMDGPFAGMSAFGEQLIKDLGDRYRLVMFDYPGIAKPDSLTPENTTADLLAIADAAGLDSFGWWGFSIGAVTGYQLALASDRVLALIMGGFPPLQGPYAGMLKLSSTMCNEGGSYYGIEMPAATGALHRQYITYYEQMQSFDDSVAVSQLSCPRLAYIGDEDRPDINGEMLADMGAIVQSNQTKLESLGWEVQIHPGKGHLNFSSEETSAILADFFGRHLQG